MPNAKQNLLVSAILLGWCIALILVRIRLGSDGLAVGLLWNLFLAAVPLGCSTVFRAAMAKRRGVLAGGSFALWLLFLPNAPYLLTDLIHLGPRPGVPLWFLLAMLLSCAGTGTLIGFLSLWEVQAVVEHRFGRIWGWILAGAALMACGFGIYVGRFLRWNSWDAVTRPLTLGRALARQFVDAGPSPHPLPVTIIFGIGLILGYLALRVVANSAENGK